MAKAIYVEIIRKAFEGDQAPEAALEVIIKVVIYARRSAISIASQITSRQSTYLRNRNTLIKGLKHTCHEHISKGLEVEVCMPLISTIQS